MSKHAALKLAIDVLTNCDPDDYLTIAIATIQCKESLMQPETPVEKLTEEIARLKMNMVVYAKIELENMCWETDDDVFEYFAGYNMNNLKEK